MTKTMGQTVYDIFGPNIGHSAASQIAALGEYALTDEYIGELKREAESDAEMARLYIEDHKRTQEKEYLEYANQYRKGEREKLRLIEELWAIRGLAQKPENRHERQPASECTEAILHAPIGGQRHG